MISTHKSTSFFDSQELLNAAYQKEQQRLNAKITGLHSELSSVKALLGIIPVFLGQLSAQGIILDLNDLSLEKLGKTRSQMIGQFFWEAEWWSSLDDAARCVREAVELACQGQSSRFDIEYCSQKLGHDAAEIRWVDLQINPKLNASGEICRLAVCGVDITERKEAQSNLEKSQTRYREAQEQLQRAFDSARMSAWRLDLNNKKLNYDINDYRSLLLAENATKAEEISGSKLKYVHPEDVDRIAAALHKAVQNNETYHEEYRTIDADGTLRWVMSQGSPQYDHNGTPLFIEGLRVDITAQKQASLEAEFARYQLHDFFTQSPIPMAILDGPLHRFVLTNAPYDRLIGRKLLGQTVSQAFGPEAVATYVPLLDQVYTTGVPYIGKQIPRHLLDAHGVARTIFTDVSYYPFFDTNHQVKGVLAIVQDVTEQVQYRQALEASEARFRLMLDTIPQIIWVKDTTGGLTYANQRWYEYTGLTLEQSLGDHWQSAIHPDDASRAIEQLQTSMALHQTYEVYYRIRSKDGYYRYHVSRGVQIYDDKDATLYWIVTLTDIDEQKRNEEQLISVIEGTSDRFYAMDHQWRIIRVNRHFERTVQKSRDELVGKHFWEVFPEAIGTRYWHECQRVMRDRQATTFEVFDKKHDIWTNIHLFPIQEDGIAEFFRDVTVQKTAELKLQASEERFRTYTEAMPQMAFMTDPQSQLTYFNQKFYDYLGLQEHVQDWDWQQEAHPVHHPDDFLAARQAWEEATRLGKTYQAELRFRHKSGVYRWHLSKAIPVRDDTGQIIQWIGTNIDIDEQKQNQQKLAKALHARDELLSLCSHELLTPVSIMKLLTQIFKRGLAKKNRRMTDVERVQQLVQQTDRQLDRLTRLIRDMSDFSRMNKGPLQINREDMDLASLVSHATEQLTLQFDESGCTPITDIQGPVNGHWDKLRLQQVVMNLLSNALKYGATKPVYVRLTQTTTQAVLTVEDNGIGIGLDDQKRIFKPYERAIAANNISGLGLGLYISQQIVQAHGGKIELISKLGHGSIFKVVLPKKS